jgi:hypothetical protein
MTPIEKKNKEGRTDDEERDYREFLAKAKREEEKAEKKRQMEVREAERRKKEFNMSPWASRM